MSRVDITVGLSFFTLGRFRLLRAALQGSSSGSHISTLRVALPSRMGRKSLSG